MNINSQHPDELLAFYVNKTLSDAEHQQVHEHVTHCERCHKEVEILQAIQKSAKESTEIFPREFAWQRFKRDLKATKTENIQSRAWWRPALATAAAIIIVVQSAFIAQLPSDDSYTQAGSLQKSFVVQVKFNPNAREEQIRNALLNVDADIIEGPSALGIYRVKLTHLQDDPKATNKLKTLRANKHVFNYIARE